MRVFNSINEWHIGHRLRSGISARRVPGRRHNPTFLARTGGALRGARGRKARRRSVTARCGRQGHVRSQPHSPPPRLHAGAAVAPDGSQSARPWRAPAKWHGPVVPAGTAGLSSFADYGRSLVSMCWRLVWLDMHNGHATSTEPHR